MVNQPRSKDPTEPQAFLSLAEWLHERWKDKSEAEVLRILRLLPEDVKEKYRALWLEEKMREKEGKNEQV